MASRDLTLARVVEPHVDALAILEQASLGPDLPSLSTDAESTWGVFAAEAPEHRLRASRGFGEQEWSLRGTKPWCSLAGHLSHALVTAWVSDDQRGLFAVRLRTSQVDVLPSRWRARGLPLVESGPVHFDAVPAVPVGDRDWYATRSGFAWGGIGVAACWYGGAVGLARRLAAPPGRPRDQIGHLHLGRVDTALHAGHCVLLDAARRIDGGDADGATGRLLALRARQVVADACEAVLREVDHALGPAPLAFEEEHAGRVDDLRLYLRQHHAERDLAAHGAMVADRDSTADPGLGW